MTPVFEFFPLFDRFEFRRADGCQDEKLEVRRRNAADAAMFATANGAAGDASEIDGLSREAETSGSE